jgi:hypothetical protein
MGGRVAGDHASDFARLEQRTLAPDRAWLSVIVTADPRWA